MKALEYKKFLNPVTLTKFVNNNDITVVSITSSHGMLHATEHHLFYKEKD